MFVNKTKQKCQKIPAPINTHQLRRIILNQNANNHNHGSSSSGNRFLSSTCGLSLASIARFPIIKYRHPVASQKPADTNGVVANSNPTSCCSSSSSSSIKCSICLENFKENQEVRLLSCFHQFHVECIDTWLMEKSTCPTCKFNLTTAINNNDWATRTAKKLSLWSRFWSSHDQWYYSGCLFMQLQLF